MEYFVSFIIGIFSSAFVALSFVYFVFWKWKPNIEISSIIVKQDIAGKDIFKIKIINRDNFPAYDVKIEAWEKEVIQVSDNSNCFDEIITKIDVSTSSWLSLPKYSSNKKIKTEKYAPHCVTIKLLSEQIEKIISTNNKGILIEISAKHGLSNVSKTFVMNYNGDNCLKNGKFAFGNSLNFE